MKCIEVKESLDRFLDDELDFSKKEKMGLHLGTCVSCQTEFQSVQIIGETIKKTLPIAAPKILDEKVISAFQSQHAENEAVETVGTHEKFGWFGIPKFALAASFLFLALFSSFAFQLGRMSVNTSEDSTPVSANSIQKDDDENRENPLVKDALDKESETKNILTKIVEVPIVKERIVRIPVIKEKIVTKTIYVNRYRNRIKIKNPLGNNKTSEEL